MDFYKRQYDVTLKETKKFDETYLKQNLENGDYIIFDTSNLSEDNPLHNISNGYDLLDNINDIPLYRNKETNKFNVFEKDPKIYFYLKKNDKGEDKEYWGEINKTNENTYSNYLKSFIIYDLCLDFINNLDSGVYPFKDELLKLYTTEDNKKKLIKGSHLQPPPLFITILWDLLYHLTGLSSNEFFTLLKTQLNIKYTYKTDLSYDDIKAMILFSRIPFNLSGRSPVFKSLSSGFGVSEGVIEKTKKRTFAKIKELEQQTQFLSENPISIDSSSDQVDDRHKLLTKMNENVDILISFIDNLPPESQGTFMPFRPKLEQMKNFIIDYIDYMRNYYSSVTNDNNGNNNNLNTLSPMERFAKTRQKFEGRYDKVVKKSKSYEDPERIRKATHAGNRLQDVARDVIKMNIFNDFFTALGKEP